LVAPALAVVLGLSLAPLVASPVHAEALESCAPAAGDPVPDPLPGSPPDLNGRMYLIVNGHPIEYLDVEREFPDF
jgi:hypothetical protein